MRITKKQKNELGEIVKKSNLEISFFEISDKSEQFSIKYKADYFRFIIQKIEYSKFRISIFPVDNINGYHLSGSWEDLVMRFKKWIHDLEIEIMDPYIWQNAEVGVQRTESSLKEIKEEVILNLGKNKIRESLELLEKAVIGKSNFLDSYKIILGKKAEFNKFENDKSRGIIPLMDEIVILNRLRASIIDFVLDLG